MAMFFRPKRFRLSEEILRVVFSQSRTDRGLVVCGLECEYVIA